LFENGYLFYQFFVVKSNAVQFRSNVKWLSFNLGHFLHGRLGLLQSAIGGKSIVYTCL